MSWILILTAGRGSQWMWGFGCWKSGNGWNSTMMRMKIWKLKMDFGMAKEKSGKERERNEGRTKHSSLPSLGYQNYSHQYPESTRPTLLLYAHLQSYTNNGYINLEISCKGAGKTIHIPPTRVSKHTFSLPTSALACCNSIATPVFPEKPLITWRNKVHPSFHS